MLIHVTEPEGPGSTVLERILDTASGLCYDLTYAYPLSLSCAEARREGRVQDYINVQSLHGHETLRKIYSGPAATVLWQRLIQVATAEPAETAMALQPL
jgi:hypothetical protein